MLVLKARMLTAVRLFKLQTILTYYIDVGSYTLKSKIKFVSAYVTRGPKYGNQACTSRHIEQDSERKNTLLLKVLREGLTSLQRIN